MSDHEERKPRVVSFEKKEKPARMRWQKVFAIVAMLTLLFLMFGGILQLLIGR